MVARVLIRSSDCFYCIDVWLLGGFLKLQTCNETEVAADLFFRIVNVMYIRVNGVDFRKKCTVGLGSFNWLLIGRRQMS